MAIKTVGIVGWRGMVGSVLMQRMLAEGDFDQIDEVHFFTTSQTGQNGPEINGQTTTLIDAMDIEALANMDAIVTCQGGDYTSAVFPKLRSRGWNGYWIDAASSLRMQDDAIIVLDPVNRDVIDAALDKGVNNLIGGNCTVSLMLMGLGGLLKHDLVEWMTAMTYQAASGSGAQHMRELVAQMGAIHASTETLLIDPASSILEVDRSVSDAMMADSFPTDRWAAPLAGSLIPWVDSHLGDGLTREEWKGPAESNKILGREDHPIPIDGLCVRIGAMRSHAQALTIKLRKNIPLNEIESMIGEANDWVEVIPNLPEPTRDKLTPAYTSGSLNISVGRLRKMNLGDDYLAAFTVGDQLLWGAAEPLRRMLRIVLER